MRPQRRRRDAKALVVLISFSAAGAIFCLVMSRSDVYNIPPPVSILFYSISTNMAILTLLLTVLCWAEVAYNDTLTPPNPHIILEKYRPHWILACIFRATIQGILCIFSALNLNNSYLIVHRIWLLDWTWSVVALMIILTVVARRLVAMLQGKAMEGNKKMAKAIKRVTRFRNIIFVAFLLTFGGTLMHAIFLEAIDSIPGLSIPVIASYHVASFLATVWFMVAQPTRIVTASGNTTDDSDNSRLGLESGEMTSSLSVGVGSMSARSSIS